MTINYRGFIQDNFLIRNKFGVEMPFAFNPTQNYYYDLLDQEYPDWQGVRENMLKFRQWGGSVLIDAIFTTDFIFSEIEEAPIINGDIYSYTDEQTRSLFERCDFFLDSFLRRRGANPFLNAEFPRKSFLASDRDNRLVSRRGAELNVRTANAKVSGRGGTKQNMHFSEVSFYPTTDLFNAESLVMGAEEQVLDGVGKIFRETTGGRYGDFFNIEYERGSKGESGYRSRFIGWWLHKDEYTKPAPSGWTPPAEYEFPLSQGASVDQCFWHFTKVQNAKDKTLIKREYPNNEAEAFLYGGNPFFDIDAVKRLLDESFEPVQIGGMSMEGVWL